MNIVLEAIQPHWPAVEPILVIRNEEDYDRAIGQLNNLIDEVGTDEQHPLYELLDTLGTVLHVYEEAHHTLLDSSPSDVLSFLMNEHELTQSGLPEVGSQGVVSEVLNGKRKLNVRQIRALSARFGVSPAVFF